MGKPCGQETISDSFTTPQVGGEFIKLSNLERLSILLFVLDVWPDILGCVVHNTRDWFSIFV